MGKEPLNSRLKPLTVDMQHVKGGNPSFQYLCFAGRSTAKTNEKIKAQMVMIAGLFIIPSHDVEDICRGTKEEDLFRKTT